MKARVYEVAKDVGLENQQLIAKIRTLGIEVKNHMSSLEGEDVARIKRALDKERQARLVEERLSPTVIRRRSKAGAGGAAAAAQFIDLQTGDKKTIPDTFDNARVRKVIEYWAYHGVHLDVIRGIEKKIRHTYTAADIVLYDDWSLDRSFTTIPFFAYFRRGKTRGFVDDLLDPQREINKRRSSMLHILATQSNSGWIWTRGSLNEEMVERVENEGARPGLHIEVESGFERPSRIEPAAPPANVERAEKVAAIDLKEISGINDSALGNLDGVQSVRAVIARQRQANVGAEEFFDNFARSRELRARRLLEMIQTYYTEQRLIRVRGDAPCSNARVWMPSRGCPWPSTSVTPSTACTSTPIPVTS